MEYGVVFVAGDPAGGKHSRQQEILRLKPYRRKSR
jgi:hypothetical protein